LFEELNPSSSDKEIKKFKSNIMSKFMFGEHHQSHAGSAFYPSPFEESAILTIDGVGEWATTTIAYGDGNNIKFLKEINFPHSLGLLYSAFTYYTGFKVNSGEYKVMGLAPYGEPKYVDLILNNLIDLKDDGSFKLNMEYFNFVAGLTMTNEKFNKLFGGEPRKPESELTQREMDLARSVQDVTEIAMIKMAKHIKKVTGEKYLALAGGVALNCVANGKILRENIFDDIWIQPAAGDAGGALGAALFTWYQYFNNPREADNKTDFQKGSYLGPEFSVNQIEQFLKSNNIKGHKLSDEDLYNKCADLLNSENVIGWFQGRMEFGPRALGNRSIIGDARSSKMQSVMNLKIKFRESFRPFAPAVLEDKVSDYFEIDRPSPYMLLVADVRKERRVPMSEEEKSYFGIKKLNVKRSDIPAVTHVDYSARIQTISQTTNPRFYSLVAEFDKKHGSAVVVNTSFNVRGEPIVCTPEDAYRCFMRTDMDVLALGNYLLYKDEMNPLENDSDWRKEFELD
jgi:carbamoyltransferase